MESFSDAKTLVKLEHRKIVLEKVESSVNTNIKRSLIQTLRRYEFKKRLEEAL